MAVMPPSQANPHPSLVIFDDQQGRFGPMTDRRPSFELRTGAMTTRRRIERALGIDAKALHVADRHAAVVAQREPAVAVNRPLAPGQWLLVNGRLSAGFRFPVREQWAHAAAVVDDTGRVLCAWLPHDRAQAMLDNHCRWREDLGDCVVTKSMRQRLLLERPWHILDDLEAVFQRDLAAWDGPRVAPSAAIHPTAVLIEDAGPVIVAQDAAVGPLAVLQGPCVIGRGSAVQPHSFIRPNTLIGDDCKVAGEIRSSIIGNHTNKAHYGYLGHALVGEWVNLGAGTTASNLKNTYGEVRVQLTPEPGMYMPGSDVPEPTGRVFHGPIIGDFARTAIGTMIPTGACLGTACMIATSSFAPKYVPAGVFCTDAGHAPSDPDRLIGTIGAMTSRRKITLTAAEEALLRTIVAGS